MDYQTTNRDRKFGEDGRRRRAMRVHGRGLLTVILPLEARRLAGEAPPAEMTREAKGRLRRAERRARG